MAGHDEREEEPANHMKHGTDSEEDEDGEEIEDENWDDWGEDAPEQHDSNTCLLCLFCDSVFDSGDSLFQHCASTHSFDFYDIKKACNLDFYRCIKLINYVRSQVAENKCWSCGVECMSKKALQEHLHKASQFEEGSLPWNDDRYLNPFLRDDPLLYSFDEDDEDDDMSIDGKELKSYIPELENIEIDDEIATATCVSAENGKRDVVSLSERDDGVDHSSGRYLSNGQVENEKNGVVSLRTSAHDIKIVNRSYFGSYSSFSIHREMISDKVRTEAYRDAVLENPSLLQGAVVMDVGCGTGILSLFAAQAGASKVIAVEASRKMASVATQIARDNNLLFCEVPGDSSRQSGVVQVVECMVEELDEACNIKPKSVDVLVSEWMGYSLLYESMLASVLFARDKWLKPGGAVLPDTATMFVAGFGKAATSIPFWENVYGFDMSCISREVVEDASRIPIIDFVDKSNIVTSTETLQAFDLVTMQPKQMDFTAEVELIPKSPEVVWCYGVALWFETGFTARFCVHKPVILSTSPYGPATHWAQTLLTFREPLAMASSGTGSQNMVDSPAPAASVRCRISIARAPQHRSIDISLEVTCVGLDGRRHCRPPQMFSLQ